MPTPSLPPRHEPSIWFNAMRLCLLFMLIRADCLGPVGPIAIPPPVGVAPAVWMTDSTSQKVPQTWSGTNNPLPLQPLDGQETRTDLCMQRVATHINGGCWIALHAPPPCIAGTFLYRGLCYAPQTRVPDVPVSGR